MRALAHRGFTRSGGRGFHTVHCTTFDPHVHNVNNMNWYLSYMFYGDRKATDAQVDTQLDNFVTTLREHLA